MSLGMLSIHPKTAWNDRQQDMDHASSFCVGGGGVVDVKSTAGYMLGEDVTWFVDIEPVAGSWIVFEVGLES